MGNNFIRKGSGLARTPPRRPADGGQSYSNSPIEEREEEPRAKIEVNRAFMEMTPIDMDDTGTSPISWPSRADMNAQKQSPLGGPRT